MLARLILVAALCLMAAPVALASNNDADFGSVNLIVEPTVEVTVVTAEVPLGPINATDPICATVGFEVHANGQQIAMAVGASILYKDDNPHSLNQIPVDQTTDAEISVNYGTWTQTHTGLPTLLTSFDAGVYGLLNIYHTNNFNFASGDDGTWSYPVNVNVCWRGYDAEIFQGRYSGAVVLWATYVAI
jgi:hypothetical protein